MVLYKALPQVDNGKEKPFRIMSRRPGIGDSYRQRWKAFHKARSDSVVYVFDTPNAMPRYYRDFFYNAHERALVVQAAVQYSFEHPQVTCPVEHEKLSKRLNRKHR